MEKKESTEAAQKAKENYDNQKEIKKRSLHSDFQAYRFIFQYKQVKHDDKKDNSEKSKNNPDKNKDNSDKSKNNPDKNEGGINENTEKSFKLYPICEFFGREMIKSNVEYGSNLNNLLASVDLIHENLEKITKKKFQDREGFEQFMAYISILKQVRTAFFSDVEINNRESENKLYEKTNTPIEVLFKDSNSENNKSGIESNGNKNYFDLILNKYTSSLLNGQEYINSYAIPICIFNDSNTDYSSKIFWNEYVKLLSIKLYLIFIAKAILKMHTNNEDIIKFVDFFLNTNVKNSDSNDKSDEKEQSDDDNFEADDVKIESDKKSLKKEIKVSDFGNSKKEITNGEIDNSKKNGTQTENIASQQPKPFEPTAERNQNKPEKPKDEKTKNEKTKDEKTKDEKSKNKKSKDKKKILSAATNNESSSITNNNCYENLENDFLDFSPILSENFVTLKRKPSNENKTDIKNLSYDISVRLIQYFKDDLNQILKVVEQNVGDIYHIYVFEVASNLIEILKIANALLYENGAEIPPLSFIWKQIKNFKSRLRKAIFTIINTCIIEKDISYNFATNSFATVTQSLTMKEVMKKYSSSETASILKWITQRDDDGDPENVHGFLDFYQIRDFGVDSVSLIASLIGEKQMNIILSDLIYQLENKTNEFCEKYKEYIVNFNFHVDVSSESQNLYVIKEYFNSFTKYFNLPHSIEIVKCISKIGNIIALIILFDSATASEFTSKEMISASIASKFPNEKEFSMYINSPNFNHQRHNYMNIAIQRMNEILNNSKYRIFFEEINGHSAFYQFAISLIYASSHKVMPMQNQYQDSKPPANSLFGSSDSISITCSIFLEILSQYELYAYSNILRAFLLFDESGFDNYDNSNEMGADYNVTYKPKLKSNIQIVDLFHYSLAGFSFQTPNHLIICRDKIQLETQSDVIKELVLYRCNYVAILIASQGQRENNIKEIFESPYINVVDEITLSISKKGTVDVLDIKGLNGSCKNSQCQIEEYDNLIISIIRKLTKLYFGIFSLTIFQKKRALSHKLKIDENFLINLHDHFPYIIENENYLTPKKGRIPIFFNSSLSNFFLEKHSDLCNLGLNESIPLMAMPDPPKSVKREISPKFSKSDPPKSERLDNPSRILKSNSPRSVQKNISISPKKPMPPQLKKD